MDLSVEDRLDQFPHSRRSSECLGFPDHDDAPFCQHRRGLQDRGQTLAYHLRRIQLVQVEVTSRWVEMGLDDLVTCRLPQAGLSPGQQIDPTTLPGSESARETLKIGRAHV